MLLNRKSGLSVLICLGATLSGASAHAVTFFASQTIGGYNYSASADFTYNSLSHVLSITLKNTASSPIANQGQGLSGLYFDVLGNPTLTASSASVGSGATIVNDSPNLNDSKIGQEWAFRNNIGTAEASFTDARYGISATGLNIFGPSDRFDTTGNLSGPSNGSVAGDDFDIVPGSQASYSGGGLDGTPFVQNAMVFYLNTPTNFTLNANTIANVAFHYGSDQSFPTLNGASTSVPEPGTLALLSGIVPLGAVVGLRRRKARQNRKNG